jgi:hypothetical protein
MSIRLFPKSKNPLVKQALSTQWGKKIVFQA